MTTVIVKIVFTRLFAVAGNVDVAFDLIVYSGLRCTQQQLLRHLGAAVLGIAEGTGQAVIRRAGFGEVANLDLVGPGVGAYAGCGDAHAPIIVKQGGWIKVLFAARGLLNSRYE